MSDDLLTGTRARPAAHYDGRDWFGNMMRIVEHPRISYMVKIPRRRAAAKGAKAETSWYLDGENLGSREAVLAAYAANPLPTLTDEQIKVLALVGDAFGPPPEGLPSRIPLAQLAEKGCVEHDTPAAADHKGPWPLRRTPMGRSVLKRAGVPL